MIVGSELGRWLSDPSRQAPTQEAMRSFAHRWRDRPLFADLRTAIEEMETRSAVALAAAAEVFFMREAEIQELVEDLASAAAADPFFRPPFNSVASPIHSGLLLFEHPDMTISLGTIPVDTLAAQKTATRGATSIYFTGQWTILHFLKAGGASLSLWETEPITADFKADSSGLCRPLGRRPVADGATLIMDGRSQSFVFEHAKSDIVCLQALITVDAAPLTIGFDSKTLAFSGASSTDEESSRTQMLVTLLRVMERTDAVPLIEEALRSPHFYTRWHIMREYLALDAEAALPRLRTMAANDPHPEVRAAAARTLELVEPEDSEDEQGPISCHA